MRTILVPMAGLGSRFAREGFALPKPFIDVAGKMMVERVLDGLAAPGSRLVLVIQERFRAEHPERLARLERNYGARFVAVARPTLGAACTCLAAFEAIDPDAPLLVSDSDTVVDNAVLRAFLAAAEATTEDRPNWPAGPDAGGGCLMTFASREPCYSYVELAADGRVTGTREKEPVSDHAICGLYHFRRGRDFLRAAVDQQIYGDMARGEYYLSGVYNHLLRRGGRVTTFPVAVESFRCLGTPAQLAGNLAHFL